jgi:hypothetical protein
VPNFRESQSIIKKKSGRSLVQILEVVQNVRQIIKEHDWFLHDGAPAHFSRNVREILDNQYPQPWIGRAGPHHWPARSPDLNPLDFFSAVI